MALTLSSCASLEYIVDAFNYQSRQKATKRPLYRYRADLQIEVADEKIDGVGVVKNADSYLIEVKSQIKIDRVEIETCGRESVCQNGKPCLDDFDVDSSFFGGAGKKMSYVYRPSMHESFCPLHIEIFDKKALAAWGYITFKDQDNNLPAQVVCNGITRNYVGNAVCQSKHGLAQRLLFGIDIKDFESTDSCNVKKISDREFEFVPKSGKCDATFYGGGHWFIFEMFAYEEVFIRGE